MKSKNKPSAILFDLGNVFIQVDPTNSIQQLENFSSLTFQQIHAYFTSSKAALRYEKGRITSQKFYQTVIHDLDISISIIQFKTLWQSIFSPIESMIRFLDEIRHQYPCYLLSNTNVWHIEYCKRHYPFLLWFEHCFYSHKLGMRKPDQTIFKRALSEIGELPQKIVFIDDREENIKAALDLGMQTIHFINYAQFLTAWEQMQYQSNGKAF